MEVIVRSTLPQFRFGNCEGNRPASESFRLHADSSGSTLRPEAASLVRLSKIEDYLVDNLYVSMLSELKARVNKKTGRAVGRSSKLGICRRSLYAIFVPLRMSRPKLPESNKGMVASTAFPVRLWKPSARR